MAVGTKHSGNKIKLVRLKLWWRFDRLPAAPTHLQKGFRSKANDESNVYSNA